MPDDDRAALAEFIEAIAPADLSAEEIAEALWLAEWIDRSAGAAAGSSERQQDPGPEVSPPHRIPVSIPRTSAGRQPSPRSSVPTDVAGSEPDQQGRAPSPPRLMGSALIRVPSPSGSEAVRFARSLRRMRPLPVRRPADAADAGAVVDEEETARFAAETGLIWPVYKRQRPRRGVAKVVVDTSVSMQVWEGLEDDIVSGLSLSRVFRRVETWSLRLRAETAVVSERRGGVEVGYEGPLARLADGSGDGAVLILSDGVAKLWYEGAVLDAVARLAARGPVALVQPLPNRLWRRTGLRPRLTTVTGAARGPEALHLTRVASEDAVPAVPIIEAHETWLATWAALASGRLATARFAVLGARPAAGYAQSSTAGGVQESGRPAGELTAVPVVRRFRAAASQGARELAAALSVVPLSLPIMQMVLATCFPDRSRAHLAEVITGGLMQRDPTVPEGGGPPAFRWLPGVGEELRREMDDRQAEKVRAALSGYLDAELGFRPDSRGFIAIMGTPAVPAGREGRFGSPFARILPDTVRRALDHPGVADTVADTVGGASEAQRITRALALARTARDTGRSAEIDEAIEAARLAVSEAASRDWPLTAALAELLEHRGRSEGSALDTEEAVIVLREYVDRVPDDDPHRQEGLERLADVLLARYQSTESPDDLDDAIRVRRRLAEAENASQQQSVLLADTLLEHHRLTGASLSAYEATDLMSELRRHGPAEDVRVAATAILARGLDVMSRSTRAEDDIEAADAVWLALMPDLGALSEAQAVLTRSAIEARIGFHRSSGRAEKARALKDAFDEAQDRLGPLWGRPREQAPAG
ncbi:SAV_2336 N-terminal domain-related protein [Catenulispora sp. GP43]|uniref:SAV_2336 N-terminal domain-related protein n=1 Tax=Catenulispora sp. GP43 TaxID=3156263 RepID=UPI0035182541